MRIEDGVARSGRFEIVVDGDPVAAFEGETIAAALLASGIAALRTDGRGRERGLFCNMGTCCECFVTVEQAGRPARRVRACLTPAAPGQRVTLGSGANG